MAHELAVWLFDKVGTLSFIKGRLCFSYDADWLKRDDSVPLSCSLPLQTQPFDDYLCRPFFAGLLPDGQLRQLIARQFHISGQNDFALLDHVGGECAGAVTLNNVGQSLSKFLNNSDIEWLSDEDVVAVLTELPHRPMLAGRQGLRLSLAGAQYKLPVVFDGQRIGLPKNGTPSSHILKPPIQAVEESVINEGFCLALANTLELKSASAKIHTVLGHTFLLVERYDRVIDGSGLWRRLHQEDFCQALGVVPEFSLLYLNKTPILAPAYDMLCTAIYPNLTPKMAMKLGSKYKFSEVQGRHWDQFSEAAGLTKAQTHKRIYELAESIPKAARGLQKNSKYEFGNHPFIERMINLIERRCTMTVKRLAEVT